MGEPGRTFDNVAADCRSYWDGKCTADIAAHATASWEWLFACPLVIGERVS
jgi:hypothetical protein